MSEVTHDSDGSLFLGKCLPFKSPFPGGAPFGKPIPKPKPPHVMRLVLCTRKLPPTPPPDPRIERAGIQRKIAEMERPPWDSWDADQNEEPMLQSAASSSTLPEETVPAADRKRKILPGKDHVPWVPAIPKTMPTQIKKACAEGLVAWPWQRAGSIQNLFFDKSF